MPHPNQQPQPQRSVRIVVPIHERSHATTTSQGENTVLRRDGLHRFCAVHARSGRNTHQVVGGARVSQLIIIDIVTQSFYGLLSCQKASSVWVDASPCL